MSDARVPFLADEDDVHDLDSESPPLDGLDKERFEMLGTHGLSLLATAIAACLAAPPRIIRLWSIDFVRLFPTAAVARASEVGGERSPLRKAI